MSVRSRYHDAWWRQDPEAGGEGGEDEDEDEWDELLDRIDWYFTTGEQVMIFLCMGAFAVIIFELLVIQPLYAWAFIETGEQAGRLAFQS